MTLDKKFAIGVGITSSCNMNCNFCYSIKRRDETSDLPIENWFSFFDKNNNYIENINFGTGENTLVDSWFDLVDYIGNINPTIG